MTDSIKYESAKASQCGNLLHLETSAKIFGDSMPAHLEVYLDKDGQTVYSKETIQLGKNDKGEISNLYENGAKSADRTIIDQKNGNKMEHITAFQFSAEWNGQKQRYYTEGEKTLFNKESEEVPENSDEYKAVMATLKLLKFDAPSCKK